MTHDTTMRQSFSVMDVRSVLLEALDELTQARRKDADTTDEELAHLLAVATYIRNMGEAVSCQVLVEAELA